ncbi:MAG: DUF4349 domain-containing protein [Ectobacillus sp.]
MNSRRLHTIFFQPFAILLAISVLLTGCGNNAGSQNTTDSSPAPKNASEEKAELQQETANNSSKENEQNPAINRKLIKNVSMEIETTNFKESVPKLESLVKQFNGYIESSTVTGASVQNEEQFPSRQATYTIRIPASQLDAYLNKAGSIGNILTKAITTEDVTDRYFDTEARIKSLKVQEERLLELLKQSGSLKDIIELEKELSSVRYEIETLTTTLKKYDSLTEYSTVQLTLIEVEDITDTSQPKTMGERISRQFKNNIEGITAGLKSIIVFVIGNSPLLIISGIIIAAGIFVARKFRKRKKNNSTHDV